jgi:hypothetical protein
MPINSNVSASDYTTYLKQRAIVVRSKNDPSQQILNAGLRTSEISALVTPTTTALRAPIIRGLPPNTRNYYRARSKITW